VTVVGDFSDVKNTLPFMFYAPAVVTSILPVYGPKNGGTIVTIEGENFTDFGEYLRCSFGTKEVMAQYISPTLIYCKAPPSDTVNAGMPFRVTLNDQ
jgi:hypothetical protein